MKIKTINVKGNRSIGKQKQILVFALKGSYDVLGLQEVSLDKCDLFEQHYHFLSNVGPKKLGTAFLIRNGINYTNELLEPEGRLISVNIGSFTLINVYGVSGQNHKEERNIFFRKTLPAYAIASKLPKIIIGDFNCINEGADRISANGTKQRNTICKGLVDVIKGFDFVDIWSKLRQNDKGHTFFHSRGSSRIDRVLVDKVLEKSILSINTEQVIWTDHKCISLHINTTNNIQSTEMAKTKGIWKLNASVLQEEAYRNRIKQMIDRISSTSRLRKDNVSDWWEEVFKPNVKKEFILYCKERAQIARDTKQFNQQCIRELVSETTIDWAAFKELKTVSRQWEENLLRGFGILSRDEADFAQEPSVFHVRKARMNGKASKIDKLLCPNMGSVLSNKEDNPKNKEKQFESVFKDRPPPNPERNESFLSVMKERFSEVPNYLTEPVTHLEAKDAVLKTK